MQYDIYDLILSLKLRKRPGMFIGDVTPNNLLAFVSGYQTAMRDVGAADVSIPPFHGFHDWIATKFCFSNSTAGWAKMILAITLGADAKDVDWEGFDRHAKVDHLRAATQRCFELIDEFRGSNHHLK